MQKFSLFPLSEAKLIVSEKFVISFFLVKFDWSVPAIIVGF